MRDNRVIIVVVAALVLLMLCLCFALLAWAAVGPSGGLARFGIGPFGVFGAAASRVDDTIVSEVRVDGPAVLTVRNQVGEVNVRTGPGNVVVVEARRQARAENTRVAQSLLDQITVNVSGSGNRAIVDVSIPTSVGTRTASVRLDITVPAETDLEIRNDVGSMRVDGVTGIMTLHANVGDMVVRNVILTGPSRLTTDVGRLEFAGSLPEEGEVAMTTRVGELRLDLPRESEFRLDAQANIGDIRTDFELEEREAGREGVVGAELRGRVGADPGVSLVLRSNTGAIAINAR